MSRCSESSILDRKEEEKSEFFFDRLDNPFES